MHSIPHEAAPASPPATDPATAAPAPEPETLLRLPQVLEIVGLKRSAWLDLVRTGAAPAVVKIGRATSWPSSEVQAFIRARIRLSRGAR